ncbi:ATP-binding protein [Mesorhizobium sp. ES1-6]|uniref:ATP-binding protein n=1 Tax=Mesorhizobium sp. ES1-6 TaxID=2876626 RepID=UPI001CCD68D6|nr:ATP-binding protein [Mesorhizobium sp. ES1-6]MBZ9801200.1 ATP-binding protein [Mesorhizobium sp. ES1-6]
MVEALRGLGYSPATAIADLVDNSIAARASAVDIRFVWNGPDSSISITDNGAGMDEQMLDSAMRLGERSPLEQREKGDLGRFGLGLKTASFSQARRLTVASRRDGATCSLRWDLDVLRDDPTGSWSLLEGPSPGSESLLMPLDDMPSGTMVLWEIMDRIVPAGSRDQDFLAVIDRIERHLSMVFHRYLEARRLVIRINGTAIRPWDPFLRSRPDTWRSGSESFRVNGHGIEVEGFVLPHKDRLTPKEYDEAAGPDGWTSQQGFYVYRNERLLVAGHWLGLGQGRSWTKEEPFRLARIRLDIPNSADEDWKIDIRKSTARPPLEARARLSLFAEDVRQRARKVFAFRGRAERSSGAGPVSPAWHATHLTGGLRYQVDRNHPAVAAVIENSGALRDDVIAMLRIIEETVPVQQIWLDTAEAKETPRTGFQGVPPEEVRSVMQTVFNNLVNRKGFTEEQARRQLAATEPFDSWPAFVETLKSVSRG